VFFDESCFLVCSDRFCCRHLLQLILQWEFLLTLVSYVRARCHAGMDGKEDSQQNACSLHIIKSSSNTPGVQIKGATCNMASWDILLNGH